MALGTIDNDEDMRFYSSEMLLHFIPIPTPGQYDWLAAHHEDGQTYDEYRLKSRVNSVTSQKNVIYLLPLEVEGNALDDFGLITKLSKAMKIFYQLEVKMLNPLKVANIVNTRIHLKKLQLNTKDILNVMQKNLPGDAYCMLSFTNVDLYPDESWNYVFGQARLSGRVGIFSFARYDPQFFSEVYDMMVNESEEERQLLIRERSLRVMLHETGHMFGLKHCIYYNCLLNGSNNLEESDRVMPFLCSVCLRKIQFQLQLSPAKLLARYNDLLDFFVDFLGSDHKYSKWLADHISIIQNNVNEI